MQVFEFSDYKGAIQERLKELKKGPEKVTLQELAAKIPMQYTYLSRVMHDDKAHLNEDCLHSVCEILRFEADEADYLFLLRSLSITQSRNRKAALLGKLGRLKQNRALRAAVIEGEKTRLAEEAEYLLDPLCIVVHVALYLKPYRHAPESLCPKLGISPEELRSVLKKLSAIRFLELDSAGKITRVSTERLHFSPEHPLMRTHQLLVKAFASNYVLRTKEENKHGFLLTFSGDPQCFEKIKQDFFFFLKEVEKHVEAAENKYVYQLCFDLFRWL